MGYELHITRKANWYDEEGRGITLDEWDKLAAGDPDLLSFHFNGPFYDDATGNIATKNPEKPIRVKMHRMAQRLDAKVQGDDLEFYGPDGEPIDPAKRRWISDRDLLLLVLILITAFVVLCRLR